MFDVTYYTIMNRTERVTVWNPELTDEIFEVSIDGIQREQITTDDSEYIGTALSGDRVTFEIRFPTADETAHDILPNIISNEAYETGPYKQDERYVVYDLETDGAFDIGCEDDETIVVHPKRNCTAETIQSIYKAVESAVSARIQIVRYWYTL